MTRRFARSPIALAAALVVAAACGPEQPAQPAEPTEPRAPAPDRVSSSGPAGEEPAAAPRGAAPAAGDQPVASPARPADDRPAGDRPVAPPADEPATAPADDAGRGGGAPLVPCEQEIALQCADGLTDGCLIQTPDSASGALTLYHVCVPEDEKPNQPCQQEIARLCGDDLVDACLHDPPVAETHVCVEKPR